jgi:hypothetical protein
MTTPLPEVSRTRRFAALAVRAVLGLTIGVFLHYVLYRLSLPVQPFIYVAF